MNNTRQLPLLLEAQHPTRICTSNFRCCTLQEIAQLKWRCIYTMISVFIDIAHIWLSIVFIIFWPLGGSFNYYHLIPFIPTILIGCILAVSLARERLVLRNALADLEHNLFSCLVLYLIIFSFLLILVFAIAVSLVAPNSLFALITSNALLERTPQNNNSRLQAAYLRRQQIYFKYISAVLQYVTGSESFKENIHRIVATNYYLQSVFHEALPDAKTEKNAIYLDRIRHLHEQIKPNPDLNKLIDADLHWSELADVVTSDNERMLRIHIGGVLYVLSFIQTVLTFWWTGSGGLMMGINIVFVVYVVLQVVTCRLYYMFYTFALYLTRILPIFNWDAGKLKALKWKQKFETPEDMMIGIRAVHEILYEVHNNEIQCIYECVLQYDIAGLIAQYIWIELPVYANIVDGIECYLEYKEHLDLPKGVEVVRGG
eukprot:946516_1